jgi:hypothetical protein
MWPWRADDAGINRPSSDYRLKLLCTKGFVAEPLRIFPSFGGQRSIQLSYGCFGVHLADCPALGNVPAGG